MAPPPALEKTALDKPGDAVLNFASTNARIYG